MLPFNGNERLSDRTTGLRGIARSRYVRTGKIDKESCKVKEIK